MRLLSPTLLCSVTTLFATLLLFSQRCDGAGNDLSASSSGTADPPYPDYLIRQNIRATDYMGTYLKPIKNYIMQLDRSWERRPPLPLNPNVPFYESRIPLFSVREDRQTVAQALRDYGSVGIVDLQHGETSWIEFDHHHGTLRQQPFEKLGEVLTTFGLNSKIHRVVNAVWGLVTPPATRSIDGLPHFQGIPIMIPNQHDDSSLYTASVQDSRAFWYPRARGKYMLINPQRRPIYQELGANDDRTKGINSIVDEFEKWRQTYGRGLAELKWGRPLHLDQELVRAHPEKPNIVTYPRLGSYQASRQDMIDALKVHGRFRLYLTSPGQPNGQFRVKLVREGTSRQGRPLDVSVTRLSKAKIAAERVAKVNLPERVHVIGDVSYYIH